MTRKLSDTHRADAARLNAIYKERKASAKRRGETLTQSDVSAACGWSGQSALSQYVLARVPLNLSAVLKLSRVLGCQPEDISPVLASELREFIASSPGANAQGTVDSSVSRVLVEMPRALHEAVAEHAVNKGITVDQEIIEALNAWLANCETESEDEKNFYIHEKLFSHDSIDRFSSVLIQKRGGNLINFLRTTFDSDYDYCDALGRIKVMDIVLNTFIEKDALSYLSIPLICRGSGGRIADYMWENREIANGYLGLEGLSMSTDLFNKHLGKDNPYTQADFITMILCSKNTPDSMRDLASSFVKDESQIRSTKEKLIENGWAELSDNIILPGVDSA